MKQFLLSWVFLLTIFSCSSTPQKTPTITFKIIHFNDVYEIEGKQNGTKGGLARAKTVINQLRDQNSIVLFSGDALGGSYMSLHTQGKHMIDAFNAVGLDYAVPGNHEFDLGLVIFEKRAAESKFKWIASNLNDDRTNQPVAGALKYAVTEINGIKIGLLGLVEDWLTSTKAGDHVVYSDYIATAKQLIPELKSQGATVIIALTHMDLDDDRKLASAVPEINLILGGHDHEYLQDKVGSTLIYKTGSDWETIGEVIVSSTGHTVEFADKLHTITTDTPKDPEGETLSQHYLDEYQSKFANIKMSEIVGETAVDLDLRELIVRSGESTFGNFIADAMRHHAKSDIAMTNGGGIRTGEIFKSGNIRRFDIEQIHPFGNKVVSLEIDGQTILAMLEHGVSKYPELFGGFPQISGMRFEFDPTKPAGQRVANVIIGSEAIIADKKYTLATNDYLANGGNDYSMLKALPRMINQDEGQLLSQVVTDAVKKLKIIAPKIENRIVRK